MTERYSIDLRQIMDAEKLSEPEYFVKYGEHPAIILRLQEQIKQSTRKQGKDGST